MSKRAFGITAAILAAVIGVLAWANLAVRPRTPCDVSYAMANSRIEWTGAGYSGIYDP